MNVYDNLLGMEEVLDEFIVETVDLLEGVNEDLVSLESGADGEVVNRIFRAFHALKGTCGFLGFEQAKNLALVAEDLLKQVCNNELEPSGTIIDLLLETSNWFSSFIGDVRERADKEYEIEPLIGKLHEARYGNEKHNEIEHSQLVGLDQSIDEVTTFGDSAELDENNKLPSAEEAEPATKQEDPTSVDKSVIDDYQPPECAPPSDSDEATILEACSVAKERPTTIQSKDGKPSQAVRTIRVDMERLENLMNLAGELALSRNQLGQAYANLLATKIPDGALDNLDQVNTSLARVTTEIQEGVMQMRMLPISSVFRKINQVVRGLSRKRGKQVQLELIGEETELDRSVIEAIGDPLLRLVRNSVDHGIEKPEDRKAAGKPEQGTVILRASHEGNHIVIEVEDDGSGVDAEKLVTKALAEGVINSSEAGAMSYREKLNLIFKAGISTAAQVTDVSGCGVGMDVVHTHISKLNGIIDVDTKIGTGTRITIKLPLAPAIVMGLRVSVWEEDYIIPLTSIIETAKVMDEDLTKVEDKWVIRFQDSVVPALFLDEWFLIETIGKDEHSERYAVIVAVAEFRYALVVTGLKGQEEVVIKPLGQALGRIPGVAGGTIGADGLITIILDVSGLICHMGLG
ncbi:MAG: chemotaxis protein CheA [Fidelibacterota bacterium]|nr:MAG: chemotaxis protein CheA [Candidatus Neomarinimicrobiota bacterium]